MLCKQSAFVVRGNPISPGLAQGVIHLHRGFLEGIDGPVAIAHDEIDEEIAVTGTINSGNLVGVISHAEGFPPMPQDLAKLLQCDIDKIATWVEQGTQNN